MMVNAIIGPDNPKVKKNFELPRTLVDVLFERSRSTRIPAVTLVQRALEDYFGKTSLIADEGEPSKVGANELRATLKEALAEYHQSLPISIDARRRTQLDSLANQLGFAETSHLVEDLARRAVANPTAAESFLYSDLERSEMNEVKASDEARPKVKRIPKSHIKTAQSGT